MALDLPTGTTCFVDANIFVYHFVELGEISAACRAFLVRVIQSEVEAVSMSACFADAVHRVMAVEAQMRFKLGSGAVAWLQRHPDRIRELSAFRRASRQLNSLPIRLLPAESRTILDAAELAAQHGLLMNDAIIVGLMRTHGLVHLVTNDRDFDEIPGLKVWKPR